MGSSLQVGETSIEDQLFLPTSSLQGAIGHDRLFKMTIPKLDPRHVAVKIGSPEIGSRQVDSIEGYTSESGISESSFSHIGTSEVHRRDRCLSQLSSTQIDSTKVAFSYVSSRQVSPNHISSIKNRLKEACFPQASPTQISSVKIAFSQVDTGKISLPEDDTLHVTGNFVNVSLSQNYPTQVQPFEAPELPRESFRKSFLNDESAKISFACCVTPEEVSKLDNGTRHLITPENIELLLKIYAANKPTKFSLCYSPLSNWSYSECVPIQNHAMSPSSSTAKAR
jgi:hypothetical protein